VRPARLVRASWSDQRYRPGFESGPGGGGEIRSSELRHVCYRINILGSQLSPSSINLVPAQAGKETVGLASHWPCVTDSSGNYHPHGLRKGDAHPAYAPVEYGTLYLYIFMLRAR